MKILNLGSCNIDYVYQVPHIVKAGETLSSKSLVRFPGGKGLNQSIAAARAGASVYHGGCCGADGGFLLDVMRESGVNTDFVNTLECRNGHAIIQVEDGGQNSIFLFGGSNERVTPEIIDRILAGFNDGDVLMLQNEISNILYAVEAAYKRGMKIVLNPSPFDETMKKIDIGMLSVIILNEIEGASFSGYSEPEKIIEYFKSQYPGLKVVLTLGCKGSICYDGSETVFCPAFRVDAVDTTAAGDTFTGYFVSEYFGGTELETALRYASAAAALSVGKNGAASSIPFMDEVRAALPELKSSIGGSAEKQQDIFRKYIKDNIKCANIKELSELLGYSRAYTSNWVRRSLGMTFSEAVQRERCACAAKLLKETELSIQEIINECGYENESFFRKIFRNEFGKSPLEYRRFYN